MARMTHGNPAPGVPPEELNMVNFTWPVTAVSLAVAVVLLSQPQSLLFLLGKLLAKGYVLWIAGAIASIAVLITYLLSVRTRFSLRHLFTAGALVSAAWTVIFISQLFHSPYISQPGSPPMRALVEQLAQWYFSVVLATFIPCPLLIGMVHAAAAQFGGDSQNRPTPLPAG